MNITGINFNGSMWAVIQGNCTQDADHCTLSFLKKRAQTVGVVFFWGDEISYTAGFFFWILFHKP